MLVHLAGLEEMVNLRGGLEYGGFNPHVRRLINWYIPLSFRFPFNTLTDQKDGFKHIILPLQHDTLPTASQQSSPTPLLDLSNSRTVISLLNSPC